MSCLLLPVQTRKMYKWIMPKVCNDQAADSVSLPHSTDLKACPPCNPGMYPVNASVCEFCPDRFFSDGSSVCKACPVSTSPEYGLHYQWWTVMPPNVSSHCIALGGEGDVCTEIKESVCYCFPH